MHSWPQLLYFLLHMQRPTSAPVTSLSSSMRGKQVEPDMTYVTSRKPLQVSVMRKQHAELPRFSHCRLALHEWHAVSWPGLLRQWDASYLTPAQHTRPQPAHPCTHLPAALPAVTQGAAAGGHIR